MARMVRTTVIGLLRKGITFDDVQGFVQDKLAEKALAGFNSVQGESRMADGEKRCHIKFSKLFDIDKLDHRWNLTISQEFRQAGYGEVAWKFTEVDSRDLDAEETTTSIHPGLFSACLDENECPPKQPPPDSLDSKAFWQWLDDLDS